MGNYIATPEYITFENLKKLFTQKQIKSLNQLNLKSRPSELKPEIYYKITKLYEKIK